MRNLETQVLVCLFIYLFIYLFIKYLFIWLCQVLVAAHGIFVAACRIFSCGIRGLVP